MFSSRLCYVTLHVIIFIITKTVPFYLPIFTITTSWVGRAYTAFLYHRLLIVIRFWKGPSLFTCSRRGATLQKVPKYSLRQIINRSNNLVKIVNASPSTSPTNVYSIEGKIGIGWIAQNRPNRSGTQILLSEAHFVLKNRNIIVKNIISPKLILRPLVNP